MIASKLTEPRLCATSSSEFNVPSGTELVSRFHRGWNCHPDLDDADSASAGGDENRNTR